MNLPKASMGGSWVLAGVLSTFRLAFYSFQHEAGLEESDVVGDATSDCRMVVPILTVVLRSSGLMSMWTIGSCYFRNLGMLSKSTLRHVDCISPIRLGVERLGTGELEFLSTGY